MFLRKGYKYNKKQDRYTLRATNAVDPATSKRAWFNNTVPCKGGKTLNAAIPEKEDSNGTDCS